MNSEFIAALGDIERERGISKDILIDAFESALIALTAALWNHRATCGPWWSG